MNSVIEDLWYGNIAPCDNCGVGDEEIERLVRLMGKHEDALRRELDDQYQEMLVQYVRWSDQYACSISAKAFRDGFSLAVKLFAEAVLKT